MRQFKSILLSTATAVVTLCACTQGQQAPEQLKSGLNPADFDTIYPGVVYNDSLGYQPAQGTEGKKVALYTLKNANGMEVSITNFGGRIVSIMVPDKDGNFQDVVLGFDKASDYFPWNNQSDFGAAIGRYANRINKGQITVDGNLIQLPQNNFGHCLHGGPTGWQYQVYDVEESTPTSLTLMMHSPDGDNNFPGNVDAHVTYDLDDDNALTINYYATTDKKTVINMTNHSYFNLNGDPNTPITDNLLTINADNFTPVDNTYMTTGEIAPVEGTPMDFRTAKEVGKDINNYDYVQLKNGNGYDHNWVLNDKENIEKAKVRLESPKTGIVLEVYTTEPGIQVYSGNFLDGTLTGKKGIVYKQRTGICLESQKYPDSPNKNWEESNPWVEPGEENAYASTCIFKFSVAK